MENRVGDWLVEKWNWPYAAAFAAVFLLALLPLIFAYAPPGVAWIYVQLPIYMLHQLEEHAGDRFRAYATATVGGGVEVLSKRATFVINSAGVWGVDLLGLYLAAAFGAGWGLVAVWLALVNAVGHVAQALGTRRYNPGLATAAFVFLPAGILSLYCVARSAGATWPQQALGLGGAILLHALIIAHVRRRLAAARGR